MPRLRPLWLIALGVKADAVPLHDNIFYATTQQSGTYRVECGELDQHGLHVALAPGRRLGGSVMQTIVVALDAEKGGGFREFLKVALEFAIEEGVEGRVGWGIEGGCAGELSARQQGNGDESGEHRTSFDR